MAELRPRSLGDGNASHGQQLVLKGRLALRNPRVKKTLKRYLERKKRGYGRRLELVLLRHDSLHLVEWLVLPLVQVDDDVSVIFPRLGHVSGPVASLNCRRVSNTTELDGEKGVWQTVGERVGELGRSQRKAAGQSGRIAVSSEGFCFRLARSEKTMI